MNAFIILLDPFLHTVNYVRNNSTVLFTSILAVSAKFLRPDLYPTLISSARHLTGRAIIDGKVSLGLIQSILLQVYWKEPEDRTAWLRIGEAIRMGALNTHELDGASMTCCADRPRHPQAISFTFTTIERRRSQTTRPKRGRRWTASERG